ncbi:MAG: hypothetical protein ACP5RM_01975 [Candidatus Micrarchaeia archaeon]
MPIKYNLMNYDIIANNIHKLQSKNESNFDDKDKVTKGVGIIIASFSSSFSWQTYKSISDGAAINLDKQEIKEEFQNAVKTNWKNIRNVDVQEVVRIFSAMPEETRERIFNTWLFLNAGKDYHDTLKSAWAKLEENLKAEASDSSN